MPKTHKDDIHVLVMSDTYKSSNQSVEKFASLCSKSAFSGAEDIERKFWSARTVSWPLLMLTCLEILATDGVTVWKSPLNRWQTIH